MNQKTLVLIKPDGIARGLVGELISRFERVGLKIIDVKMVKADEKLAKTHYPVTDEWLSLVGQKSLGDYEKFDLDPVESLGTKDPIEIGKLVHQFNIKYLTSGKVLALILEGDHAVEVVRKIAGPTIPLLAAPGTIRGDFSNDSAILANSQGRSIQNLIHASGTVEEAAREIKLWFGKE